MGGYGSGRRGGGATTEESLRISLAYLLRQRLAVDGCIKAGTLTWTTNGQHTGTVQYHCDLANEFEPKLKLSFIRAGCTAPDGRVEQTIRLTSTTPHYGGRRWWMICPFTKQRVDMIYLPYGGDRFASRKAWRLRYTSQDLAPRDRPFEALYKMQKRAGCRQGWEMPIRRPKGMWHRTFDRLERRFFAVDEQCAIQMISVMGMMGRR